MIAANALSERSSQALREAERILGYSFHDRALLQVALTHPSATQHGDVASNYERLEFLGDSILGAIIAEEVFDRFADLDEGGLTRIKVSLVSGVTLSKVADEHGFGGVIIFGESEMGTRGRGMHSALENVYEAVVAALYLDGGVEVAREWVMRTLGPHIDKDLAAEPESPKSSLQEILQAQHRKPVYEIVGESGPPHERVFTARVSVGGEFVGEGSGKTKKEAEASAARAALALMAQEG